jgi:iron complex outermembrane recepter protein
MNAHCLNSRPCMRFFGAVSFVVGYLLIGQIATAATGATGAIRGTVSNAATGNHLNDASVQVKGVRQEFLTERDGSYAIPGLAPGTYELTVSYTGLDPEKRTVSVGMGETARQDFALTSGIYKMDTFVVASELEGNAAQLNRQKKADVFTQAVSTDMLGVSPEGNIGEFLKYVPGLLVDYGTVSDARSVSMRGQDAESTLFTFDGMVPAATGFAPRANNANDVSSRAMDFRDMTIDNVESIEVFKAPPAWMAPATGGVINAVTKNAFAQKGRRLTTVFTLYGNSDMLSLQPIEGPGQRSTYRIKPGGRLNYSEAFLNNTLGVSFSYGETHIINPRHVYQMAYAPVVAGTAANPVTDATPLRFSQFTVMDGPEVRVRRNIGLDADYKLGAHTVLKLSTKFNNTYNQGRFQHFRIRNVANSSIVEPGATDTDITFRNAEVSPFSDYNDSNNQSFGYTGRVEHRFGDWRVDYSASYSKSDAHVWDMPDYVQGLTFNLATNRGVGLRIRTSPDSPAPVEITQFTGPDFYDLTNYNQSSWTPPAVAYRFQNDRTWNLKADVRRNIPHVRFPVELRAGANFYQLHRRRMASHNALTFMGPDGRPNSGDEQINASRFEKTTHGDRYLYLSRKPPILDNYKVAAYMREFPLAFQDTQGANVMRALATMQSMAQDITAAYAAATIRLTPRLTFVGGLRAEETENYVRGPVRRDRLAAGLPANSPVFFRAAYSQTQRATSKYRDYFPNWQATYRFNPDIVLRGAITRSMSRPSVQSILPSTTVNDMATIPNIAVNNVGLNPTYADNIDVGIEIYTRPSGTLSIGWFSKTITNYIINDVSIIEAGDDNGFDGQYAGYELRTQDNGGEGRFAGVEIAGRQQLQGYLKFLPEVARNWGVFFGYTRNYEGEAPNRSGVLVKPIAPAFFDWFANYGINYQTPRRAFYIEARTTIFPEAVTTLPSATDLRPVYLARKQRWDLTTRYRFNHRYSLELNVGNVFDVPSRELIRGGYLQESRSYGTTYALSFSANLADMKIPFLDRR